MFSLSCGGSAGSSTGPSVPNPSPTAPSPSSPIEILSLDLKGPAEIWIGEVNYMTAWGELSYPMYEQIGADFESLNPDLVAVTLQGKMTGMKPGTATVRATVKKTSGNLIATHTVTVLPVVVPPPTRLTLFPSPDRFWAIGERVQLQASADQPQRPGSVTVSASWTSSNPAVASVSPDGLLTVNAFGLAQVRATFRDLAAELPVNVLQPGSISIFATTQTWAIGREDHFLATAHVPSRQYGEDLTPFATWTSSNPSVLALDAPPGDVWPAAKALRVGTATITARYGGMTGSVAITVVRSPN